MSEGPGSRCIAKILVLEADNMTSKPGVRSQSDVHMAAGPRTRNSWLHCRFPGIIYHPWKGSPFKSLLALTSWDVCCWSWSRNTVQRREEKCLWQQLQETGVFNACTEETDPNLLEALTSASYRSSTAEEPRVVHLYSAGCRHQLAPSMAVDGNNVQEYPHHRNHTST